MGAGKSKRFDHLRKTKDLAAITTGTAGSRDQTPTRAPAPWHAQMSKQTDLSHHCVSRQRSRVRAPSSPLPLHKAVILRACDLQRLSSHRSSWKRCPPLCHPERSRISRHAALERTEVRQRHQVPRKSGGAQWRDLRFTRVATNRKGTPTVLSLPRLFEAFRPSKPENRILLGYSLDAHGYISSCTVILFYPQVWRCLFSAPRKDSGGPARAAGFSGRKAPSGMGRISIAEVLRLRAMAIAIYRFAQRFAQDDGFALGLKNIRLRGNPKPGKLTRFDTKSKRLLFLSLIENA
jgi:hypothetical protein